MLEGDSPHLKEIFHLIFVIFLLLLFHLDIIIHRNLAYLSFCFREYYITWTQPIFNYRPRICSTVLWLKLSDEAERKLHLKRTRWNDLKYHISQVSQSHAYMKICSFSVPALLLSLCAKGGSNQSQRRSKKSLWKCKIKANSTNGIFTQYNILYLRSRCNNYYIYKVLCIVCFSFSLTELNTTMCCHSNPVRG